MVIRKEDLALYSLSLLEADDRHNITFSKENLAYAMDISINTLDLYFTKLKKSGFIVRHKKKYYDDIRQTVVVTEEGHQKNADINVKIRKEMLTPERHNIPSIVPITMILNRINDPLERIFFLSLYTKILRFDLPFYLETIKTAKQESNIVNIINNLYSDDLEDVPIVETFFKSCFFGDINAAILEEMGVNKRNVNTLLLVAEASHKQGRFTDSAAIYEHLLSGKVQITQNQWFMAKIGNSLLKSKIGEIETALSDLKDLEKQVDNKVFKAYTKQIMARIISTTGKREESIELFNSAIRSFRTFGFPLLLSIGYNNRGISHFMMNNVKEAEKDWNLARKLTKEAKCKYIEAATLTNLSDIELLRGNFQKANNYLESARELFQDVGDLERVAIVDFNYALLELEKKNFDKAMKYFRKSETLAYPSPSPLERKTRREMFKERAQKHGFPEFEFDD